MGKIQELTTKAKFSLGKLTWTRGINKKIADDEKFASFIWESLKKHAKGDWGDLSKEDKQENEFSLDKYLRLFSAYIYEKNGRDFEIWIITEADRSSTTILSPGEY